MRNEIENRLHRVKIELEKKEVECPHMKECESVENSFRCIIFYQKCTKFKDLGM